MRTFLAYIRIMRPLNACISFAGIFVSGLIAGAVPSQYPLLAAASLSGMLIGSAGNIVNDILDLPVDRINRPLRVLPAGQVSRKSAWIWGLFCAAAGMAAAFGVSATLGIVAIACAGLVYLYNTFLKNRPLVGNIAVSLVIGTAFPFGAAAAGNVGAGWIPGIFAFLYTCGREVVKDMEDMEGDRAAGASTLPIAYGLPAAKRLATGLFLALIVFSPLPTIAGKYNLLYLALVAAGVDVLLGCAILLLWRSDSRENFRRISALLKFGMPIGIAAVYCGTLSIP